MKKETIMHQAEIYLSRVLTGFPFFSALPEDEQERMRQGILGHFNRYIESKQHPLPLLEYKGLMEAAATVYCTAQAVEHNTDKKEVSLTYENFQEILNSIHRLFDRVELSWDIPQEGENVPRIWGMRKNGDRKRESF